MAEDLTFPWSTLDRLQTVTNSPIVDARTKGREEALTVLVDELAEGKVPTDATTMERRYETLSSNRAVKHRNRRKLEIEKTNFYKIEPVMQDISDELAIRELVDLAYSQLSLDDWELLQELDDGKSYAELSLERRMKIGTLKAAVSRLRGRMRKSKIGSVIREAVCQSRGEYRKWASLRHRRVVLREGDQM